MPLSSHLWCYKPIELLEPMDLNWDELNWVKKWELSREKYDLDEYINEIMNAIEESSKNYVKKN